MIRKRCDGYNMRSCIKCGRIWCFLTDQAWWRSRRTTLILRPCRSIRHNPMVRESTLSTRVGRWQIKYIFEVLAPPKKVQKMLAPSILLPLWLSDNNIRGANVFWIDFGGTSTTKFLICYRPTAFIDIIENLRVYDFFNLVLRSTDRNSSRSNFLPDKIFHSGCLRAISSRASCACPRCQRTLLHKIWRFGHQKLQFSINSTDFVANFKIINNNFKIWKFCSTHG